MKRLTGALLIVSAAALPVSASAQAVCAKRADLLTSLQGSFSEAPVALGLSNSGGVVELLTSPEGQTWTLIVTDPEGISCLMAAGAYWEAAFRTAGRPT